MTLLDEAKIQIRAIKERPTGQVTNFTIGVHWQTLDALVEIAEAAFEMPEPVESVLGCCVFCNADGFSMPVPHIANCPYQRIQDGKKELESGD